MPVVVDVEGSWETDALVTLTTVKRFLHFEAPADASADHDTFLNILISGVSKQFETECDRCFTQTAYTEYHNGDGLSDTFRVKHPPIASSPAPRLWDDTDYTYGDDTEYDLNDDWKYDPESGIVKILWTHFYKGLQNVKMTYTGGYSSIPDDVQMAVAMWIAKTYKESRDHRWGLDSKSFGEFATGFSTLEIPAPVQAVIKKYKRRAWSN